jgi:hypothetical protein
VEKGENELRYRVISKQNKKFELFLCYHFLSVTLQNKLSYCNQNSRAKIKSILKGSCRLSSFYAKFQGWKFKEELKWGKYKNISNIAISPLNNVRRMIKPTLSPRKRDFYFYFDRVNI